LPILKLEIGELSLPELNLDLSITASTTAEYRPDADLCADGIKLTPMTRFPNSDVRATSAICNDLWLPRPAQGLLAAVHGVGIEPATRSSRSGPRPNGITRRSAYNVAIAGHVRNSKTSSLRSSVRSVWRDVEKGILRGFLGSLLTLVKRVARGRSDSYVFHGLTPTRLNCKPQPIRSLAKQKDFMRLG